MLNTRHCCLLCLLFCTLLPPARSVAATAEDWYRPAAADFRPLYDCDAINRRAEAWDGGDGYWFWVQSFYNGYQKRILGLTVFRQSGWTANGQRLEARVTSAAARAALRCALNKLGRDIAGEWAKDDSHTRISTSDLKRWGDALRRAGEQERGDGTSVLAAAFVIQMEVTRRLAHRPQELHPSAAGTGRGQGGAGS